MVPQTWHLGFYDREPILKSTSLCLNALCLNCTLKSVPWILGHLVPQTPGALDAGCLGRRVPWTPGASDAGRLGRRVPRTLGALDAGRLGCRVPRAPRMPGAFGHRVPWILKCTTHSKECKHTFSNSY